MGVRGLSKQCCRRGKNCQRPWLGWWKWWVNAHAGGGVCVLCCLSFKLQFERSKLLAACLSCVLPSPTLMHQACLAASAAFSTPAHMRGDRHTGGSSSGAAMVAAACIHGPALHR